MFVLQHGIEGVDWSVRCHIRVTQQQASKKQRAFHRRHIHGATARARIFAALSASLPLFDPVLSCADPLDASMLRSSPVPAAHERQ